MFSISHFSYKKKKKKKKRVCICIYIYNSFYVENILKIYNIGSVIGERCLKP